MRAFILFAGLWIGFGFSLSAKADSPSLEQKIGQMLMVGFRGEEISPDSAIAKDIKDRYLGGVVLYERDLVLKSQRNIKSPEQLKKLVKSAKDLAATPLLVAIDHEGGFVNRLKEKYGFPKTLSAQKMAKLTPQEFRDLTSGMGETLSKAGINLNFAPVVDVNINPESPAIGKYERSFSADPAEVSRLALTFIEAHQDKGVLTALKHFPGHGSALKDSHFDFVDITETWKASELRPYKAIIKAGKAEVIMTAHVFHQKMDKDYPATLSHYTLTGLLRGRMHFEGVIIADDMQMKAITAKYGFESAIKLAINAGVDILLFANNLVYDEAVMSKAVAVIKGMVEKGAIAEKRIDESYERIMKLKKSL